MLAAYLVEGQMTASSNSMVLRKAAFHKDGNFSFCVKINLYNFMGAFLFNGLIDLHEKKPFISSLGQLLQTNYIQIGSWMRKMRYTRRLDCTFVFFKKNTTMEGTLFFFYLPSLDLKEETLRVSSYTLMKCVRPILFIMLMKVPSLIGLIP